MKTFTGSDFNKKCLPIKIDKINKILGTKISKEQYISFLTKLGFEINDEIKVPSFRNDVVSQNDLSEEIARIIGYDDIKSIPLNLKSRSQLEQDKISKIEGFFIENGFNEIINMPFTDIEEKKSALLIIH